MKIKFLAAALCLCMACHVKEKAKEAINQTGEAVGQSASEFVKGVSSGIDHSFDSRVELSGALHNQGISLGKCFVKSGNNHLENILAAYFIFEKDVKQTVHAKVFDAQGLEYGRTTVALQSKAGEATFVELIFDPNTKLESKSKFVIE